MVRGLKYLHAGGKIHRDIKAANIMLSDDGKVKLADFGVAAEIQKTVALKSTFAGTPLWMAPEIVMERDYDFKVDIWSLGITCIELAEKKPPMAALHPMRVLFLIPQQEAPRLTGNFSVEFKDFVATCLQKDPAQRPTIEELSEHSFLVERPDDGDLKSLILKHRMRKSPKKHAPGDSEADVDKVNPADRTFEKNWWNYGANPEDQHDLSLLLKRFNLEGYKDELSRNGIDTVESLLLLTKEDLAVMNLTDGGRDDIKRVIATVKDSNPKGLGRASSAVVPKKEKKEKKEKKDKDKDKDREKEKEADEAGRKTKSGLKLRSTSLRKSQSKFPVFFSWLAAVDDYLTHYFSLFVCLFVLFFSDEIPEAEEAEEEKRERKEADRANSKRKKKSLQNDALPEEMEAMVSPGTDGTPKSKSRSSKKEKDTLAPEERNDGDSSDNGSFVSNDSAERGDKFVKKRVSSKDAKRSRSISVEAGLSSFAKSKTRNCREAPFFFKMPAEFLTFFFLSAGSIEQQSQGNCRGD